MPIDNDLYKIVESIDDNSTEFYQYLLLGQQVYISVIYEYLFLNVSSDAKNCGMLVRCIPKEDLLCSYISEIGMSDIWRSDKFGIAYKIRKSYVVLGIHYKKKGYDNVYESMRKANSDYIDNYSTLSISSYAIFLETYMLGIFNKKLTYRVSKEIQYSNKDVIYKASAIFLDKTYYESGYSKKNAIEKLAQKIVLTVLSREKIMEIAVSQGISLIEKHRFHFNETEYIESNKSISQFADKYGIEHLLMRLVFLPGNNSNKYLWDNIGVSCPDFLKSKESLFIRGLKNFGEELLLLLVLDFHLRNNSLDSIDLSLFDIMNISLPPDEIHEQLTHILNIDDLSNYLFEAINLPEEDLKSSGAKKSALKRMLSVFFISNFTPEKNFFQYFNDLLEKYYNQYTINIEIDHKYTLTKYLSEFNTRPKINSYEIANGKFTTELIIENGKSSLKYSCESESIKQSKKLVWCKAYEKLVVSVQHFFFTANENESEVKETVSFFVNKVCNNHISKLLFYKNYGFLNSKNISKMDISVCKKALLIIKKWLGDKKLYSFIKLIYEINKDDYIYVNNQIYGYGDWIASCINLQKPTPVAIDRRIAQIYDRIANSSIELQKKLVLFDYKCVNKIYPLSNEIAMFAIQQNLDAYNYLPYTNPEIVLFYQKLKEEAGIADIGTLVHNVGESVQISILDSHKPLHSQIYSLISQSKITNVTIACGYCFASGLNLLKNIIEPYLLSNIPFELYIGSLQNYDESNPDNMITGIDKTTIKILNNYLSFSNFSLYTCTDRFYHGKIYIFQSDIKTLVIVGSSNVSKSAFVSNYELNIAFVMNTEDSLNKNFVKWISQLRHYSKKIDNLEISMFGDNEIKLDGSILIKHMSVTSMQNKISQLTNSEVQYRLNLWMSYSPDVIAEDLGIASLPNYFVFVYKKYNLMVLESFEAGNSYFCLKTPEPFEEIINNISALSKTEIFEYSKMSKRGYHLPNKFTLENNIRQYFK